VRAKRRGAKQKVREFAGLVRLVRAQRPRVVLEIGTFKGGTLWAWCRLAAKDATIISVDLPGGEFGGGYADPERLEAFAREGQTLHLIRADSHDPETLAQVERLLDGRPIDFAFIDGDHTYEGVAQDYEMFGRLASTVAFHDVLPHGDPACQVDQLWRELRERHQTVEFCDIADTRWDGVWGGIGVITRPA
jgi:cephalosporin hydroxylase